MKSRVRHCKFVVSRLSLIILTVYFSYYYFSINVTVGARKLKIRKELKRLYAEFNITNYDGD